MLQCLVGGCEREEQEGPSPPTRNTWIIAFGAGGETSQRGGLAHWIHHASSESTEGWGRTASSAGPNHLHDAPHDPSSIGQSAFVLCRSCRHRPSQVSGSRSANTSLRLNIWKTTPFASASDRGSACSEPRPLSHVFSGGGFEDRLVALLFILPGDSQRQVREPHVDTPGRGGRTANESQPAKQFVSDHGVPCLRLAFSVTFRECPKRISSG